MPNTSTSRRRRECRYNSGNKFYRHDDNKALEVKVNSARVLRIEPNAASPNIIGVYSGNFITAGILGATISGGGNNDDLYIVTDNYGTVGGGVQNNAGNNAGTTTKDT